MSNNAANYLFLSAVLLVLFLFACCMFQEKKKEQFDAHELHAAVSTTFGGTLPPSYTKFKQSLPDADSVLYSDVAELYSSGDYSEKQAEKIAKWYNTGAN